MTNTPNGFTLDDALAFIRKATPEERKRIASCVYDYRQDDIQDAKAELKRGMRVYFNVNKRGYPPVIRGTITAILQKNVTVKPDNGGRPWRVRADVVKVDPTVEGSLPSSTL